MSGPAPPQRAASSTIRRATVSSRPLRAPLVLAVHGRDIDHLRLLRFMRMVRTGIQPKIAELLAAKRTARQHAFDRLLDDALGKTSGENRFCRPLFDATDIAGVLVVDFLLDFAAGQ